jgi:hypothetical protein
MTKRRQISLLPQVHQTDALKRFFDSTVDQVFQDGKTVPVTGYIGRKPAHYDATTDFYKRESSPTREKYQLEAMMVSRDEDGNVLSNLFYEDLLARLSQQGALTENPERLFKAGYYSWAPPIDIDRIMNFQQYYWAGGTSALVMTVPGVEVGTRVYADGRSTVYDMPGRLPSRLPSEESVVVLVNGVVQPASAYKHTDTKVTFAEAPTFDSTVVIFRYGNVGDGARDVFAIPPHCLASQGLTTIYVYLNGRETDEFTVNATSVTLKTPPPLGTHVMVTRIKSLKALIEGRQQFDPTGLIVYPITSLLDGMKIKLVDPTNFVNGYDLKAYGHPWDELNYSTYFVEGTDLSIVLVPFETINISGDGNEGDPLYVVVARTDKARSYWSQVNRWVHKDALITAEDASFENRAKRPIIEFLNNMRQFEYGSYRLQNSSAKMTAPARYNNRTVDVNEINGLPVGTVTIDDGFVLAKGSVFFVSQPDTSFNDKLYYVDSVIAENDPNNSLYLLEPLVTVKEGGITAINRVDYWFDGRHWNPAHAIGDYPIFDLFDSDGISLSDEGVYPDTTFKGSRIFNFAKGEGSVDAETGRALVYDKYGQIVFENELETQKYSYSGGEIGGYYYYQRNDVFENMWHRASEDFAQKIDDNNISDIPLNLQANPDFETPEFLSKNDFFSHFSSIIENQEGFKGQPYAHNNWNTTAKDVTKGLSIIQHEAPLLKLMVLMERDELSVNSSIKFVDREYTRFKAKFLKHVLEIVRTEDTTNMPSETLAKLAIKRINAGKTSNFPFNDSTVGGDRNFIPLTPALLGISPLIEPRRYVDDTSGVEVTMLRGHDGSSTPLYGDTRDDALMALELLIYRNADDVSDRMPLYDLVQGKYRTTSAYTEAEFTAIMTPAFEQWARDNNFSFENTTFDENNPFTWNYRTATDRFGDSCMGHWRGIYRHFFDTDKPHLMPWRMLGFAEQPSWWSKAYGDAPYTRDNSILWGDIEAGIIREGDRAGTHAKFARPDLMQILPVDTNGRLIDPITATIILRNPPIQFAKTSWMFGDGSPIEAAWRNTSSYQFALAHGKFLMRPNFFVERFWDVYHDRLVHGQIVDSRTLKRNRHRDIVINSEALPTGEVQVTHGIQNWIIDNMINRGLAPAALGATIRGLTTQLGHKIGGFTSSDRLTVSAESFGLVPSEDITVSLYRSPNLNEFFYSGMLIENTSAGWRVIGYNPDQPFFEVIVPDQASRKTKISNGSTASTDRVINPWRASVYYKRDMLIEHEDSVYRCTIAHTSGQKFESSFWQVNNQLAQRSAAIVNRYAKSTGIVERIPYGTQFRTKQEVADLMFGYEAYLLSRGFVFAEADDATNSWTTAVRNFLKWSEINWSEGSFVTLSPAARELKFVSETGIVTEITDSIFGRTGHTLKKSDFAVDRFEDTTLITASSEDIYGARLNKIEIEHCLTFSNRTIFDDVIYDALFNIRQDRLKLSARLAGDWAGQYSAPGFVLQGDDMTPNFAKISEDVREMFDIELADNTILRDHARHVIGFESRDYLNRLLLSETQQFELYQGMIQQKGSAGALSALLRSNQIGQNRDLKFLEEWAFRVGSFGAYHPTYKGEFTITQSDVFYDRQISHLTPTQQGGWYSAADNLISAPFDFAGLLANDTVESFADGGYARIEEAVYITRDHDSFRTLVEESNGVYSGETVWITHEDHWSMHRLSYPTSDQAAIVITRIDDEYSGAGDDVEDFRIGFDRAHTLKVDDVFYLTEGSDVEFRGEYTVLRAGTDWVEVEGLSQALYELIQSTPPTTLRLDPLRFATTAERDACPHSDVLTYVDGPQGWVVFRKIAGDWVEVRRQGKRLESSKIAECIVYSPDSVLGKKDLTVQPKLINRVTVLDPLSGLVPGVADRELDYKVEYDPADYSTWGGEEVGRLWWNVDTARFVNCYTDALEAFDPASMRYSEEMEYRAANWTKLLPTSSVDIYEWTRSLVAPESEETVYVSREEYDNRFLKTSTFYYYWVLNPITTPRNLDRRMSAFSVSQIITNPSNAGLVWMAPIAPTAALLTGFKPYLGDRDSIVQIDYRITDYEGDDHSEWLLMRPKDTSTPPAPMLWNKLLESLTGFTTEGSPIPSAALHVENRCGLEVGQSLFGNEPVSDARQSFITMLNYILGRKNLSLVGGLENKLSLSDFPSEYMFWSQHSGETPILPLASEYQAVAYSETERDAALRNVSRVLLDSRQSATPSFSVWEFLENAPALARSYEYAVETNDDLADLGLKPTDRVLIRHDTTANGFWTIGRYDPMTFARTGLVAAQKYKTRDMWYYVDWYSDEADQAFPPAMTYGTIAERTIGEGENPTNLVVRVNDDAGYWSWTKYNGKEWVTIARENGTIQLVDDFYTSLKLYGYNAVKGLDFDLSKIRGRDGSIDFAPLISALATFALTPEELNELWFSMLHFIHSRVDKVDWAAKTSFLSVLGYNERLWKSPVAVSDNLPLLLQYIDEVKPYRVKVREVIQTAAPDIELANTIATDFDKPVYYDTRLDAYRRLDDNIDADILSKGLYRHRHEHPEQVRKIKIGMLFDRIWDKNVTGSGAAERIMAYYQPGSNMRPKSIPELMGLDFKGTVYDGKTLADFDPDIVLRGSTEADSQEAVTGMKLRDPEATGKPQELVKFGATDGLVIRGHDRWGNGGPLHTVRHFDVSRRKAATASLDINTIADSVAVFRDGIRAPESAYAFNTVTHTVDVDLVIDGERVKQVAIHAFGFAAVDHVIDQQFYQGADSYQMDEAYGGFIEANLNGTRVAQEDISTDLDRVTLAGSQKTSDAVMLTHYSTNDPKPVRMKIDHLPYVANKTWALGDDILPELRPYHAGIIIEVDGVRLTPPKTFYVSKEASYFVGTTDVSKLRVYDDRTKESFAVVDFKTISTDELAEPNEVIARMGDVRFALWNQRLIFADDDASGKDYVITLSDREDFTISDTGVLVINRYLFPNQDIAITGFTYDALMDIRTHVYHGSPRGFYALRTKKNGRAWMTLNGRRLVENIDYTIQGAAGGAWDIDPFEAYSYDAFTTVQIALRYPVEEDYVDVVITTFEGRENNEARSWQIATVAPEEMRMLPITEGERPTYIVRSAYEIIALDEKRRSGILDLAIAQESDRIEMTLNPLSLPDIMMPSQPMPVPTEKTPGVIWIDGERIEYFEYDRDGLNLSIGQLRRGTRGTAKHEHRAGVMIYAGDALMDRLPPCPTQENKNCCSDC